MPIFSWQVLPEAFLEMFPTEDWLIPSSPEHDNETGFTLDMWMRRNGKEDMIPGNWRWPLEWTPVKEAYPDFVGFAADATHQTNADWYNNCVGEKVY